MTRSHTGNGSPEAYLSDPDVTIYQGDALAVLRELPAESVDCVVTSPPYWGLRDYGTDGQIGLEATPEEYVATMVAVFREVRRVLSSHGTCWVNLGDSYNANQGAGFNGQKRQDHANRHTVMPRPEWLKPKDLVGIPWRVAFALQADGWWLRSDIVWSKPNPMPESVTDRPTKAHEYVFLLTKRPRYYFDQEAVREGYKYDGRRVTSVAGRDGSIQHRNGERWPGIGKAHHEARGALIGHGHDESEPMEINHAGRNVRSVWEIATQPYPEAHFATFPEELARRCILAGCPEWVCRQCGKPRERIVERVPFPRDATSHRGRSTWADGSGRNDGDITRSGQEFNRWRAENPAEESWSSCECADYRPGVVLDPFLGSGTTALVARKHGRHAIGIELSTDYCALAARRLQQLSLFAEIPDAAA